MVAVPSTHLGPIRGHERLVLLDALRGFALLGVLVSTLRDLSLLALLPGATRDSLGTAPWDHAIELALTAVVDVKAFTIFTLLFGIGFALQAERARAAGVGLSRFGRRMSSFSSSDLCTLTFFGGATSCAFMRCSVIPSATGTTPRADAGRSRNHRGGFSHSFPASVDEYHPARDGFLRHRRGGRVARFPEQQFRGTDARKFRL